MSEIPNDLKYCSTHEWVSSANDDGVITVGITDHAQDQLGDLVFVELPETGLTVEAGCECAVIESVKAASDIYSPVGGEIVDANEALIDSPELVNDDPYGDGWLFKVRVRDASDIDSLLNADSYREVAEAE
ncbi:Glycine cleavage system H protein [hydrothermal vent metagenome]|uniref:Glycine cleavage system H protein n=1 Tax=hydrothermal vent metagenome TaxID=652676 RepID=A0A3B1C434_9ZZZZ